MESQSEEELTSTAHHHQCKLGSYQGLSTAELDKHFEAEHKDAELLLPYRCSICELDFGEKGFREHLSIHDNSSISESTLECKLCESKFSSFPRLKQHYTESHPFGSIISVIREDGENENSTTGQNFKSFKSSPKRLRKDGKSEKLTFSCEVCQKKFGRHDHMKLHLRIHTGEKPYVCKICAKSFSDPRGLAYHEITHSDERPYCRPISSFPSHNHIYTRPYNIEYCYSLLTILQFIDAACYYYHISVSELLSFFLANREGFDLTILLTTYLIQMGNCWHTIDNFTLYIRIIVKLDVGL